VRADAARLLDQARAEASRLETRARRNRQWLTEASQERTLLGVHTVASPEDATALASLLTHAAAANGRLHVVVLTDRDPDPGPHSVAQTKDTP
jgi:hypothetical protein